MEIKSVEFVKSAASIKECPKPWCPEFAFIGRSNVGKSSLINYICNNKKLAKVSEMPGKTRTINYYMVNKKWYLVDLPGYGFAKISKAEKEQLREKIYEFIGHRKTLKCILVLLDCRHEFQNSDREFICELAKNKLPFALVLTKIDKLSNSQLRQQTNYFEKELNRLFEEIPNIFLTSATKKKGKEELLAFFDYLMNTSNEQ